MAGDTIITVVGNLTADPELRYTQNGIAVANFTIASTPRSFDRATGEWKDGEALFMRASVWREFAEHVASSLTKALALWPPAAFASAPMRPKRRKRTLLTRVDEWPSFFVMPPPRFSVSPQAPSRRVPLTLPGAPPKPVAQPRTLGQMLRPRTHLPLRTHPSKTFEAISPSQQERKHHGRKIERRPPQAPYW